jgi:hypothetical protein
MTDSKVTQTSKPIILSEFLLSNIKDSEVSNYIKNLQTGLSDKISKGAIIANLNMKKTENQINGLDKIIKNKMDQVITRIKTRRKIIIVYLRLKF